MTARRVDIAILGAGFGGSLLAAILARAGREVIVLDSGQHPRFAIGESSTPLADMMLVHLSEKYDLSEIRPLAQYGSWQKHKAQLTCGPKTGFSYFAHQAGQHFESDSRNVNQLLVAASHDVASSDTHWLRQDVDHFFAKVASARGAEILQNAVVLPERRHDGWRLTGNQRGQPLNVTATLVIDCSGRAGVMPTADGVGDVSQSLKTESGAVFAHFAHVIPWEEMLDQRGCPQSEHPFSAGDAAVHHVLDDGWMWQLRFNDGTLSAGLVARDLQNGSPESIWKKCLRSYPTLAEQFAAARIVRPEGGLVLTRRLQRLWSRGYGDGWAALPSTIGFIDPLHSTGIAHTLFGIARLAELLIKDHVAAEHLQCYSDQVISELRLIDDLVAGCMAAQRCGRCDNPGRANSRSDNATAFELWCHWCMLYFAAATTTEREVFGQLDAQLDRIPRFSGGGFLLAADDSFRCLVKAMRAQLDIAVSAGTPDAVRRFGDQLREAIAPWNHAGLCDPEAQNMYRYTAAPRM